MSPKRSSYPSPASSTFLDAVIDGYVTWREASAAVSASYQRWTRAPRSERASAFDAYTAALDREEHAASAYQRLFELAVTA